MIDAAQIGLRLRAARERRGLSQQEVADALKLPRTALTNIESGNSQRLDAGTRQVSCAISCFGGTHS